MEIRGERECKSCGTRWSYYETGSVACPECDSVHSVGVEEERRLHTADGDDLDLTAARTAIDEAPEDEALDVVKSACREFERQHGFVDAGELLDLDDTYLVACELRHVADVYGRSLDPDDEEELYLLSLLGGDVDDRPGPEEVPESLRSARGLATANAVRDYRRELRDWLDASGVDLGPTETEVLSALDERLKRVRALQGDVDPREVDRLVTVVREVAAAVRDGDETAIVRARDRLTDGRN
ncbi:DUF7117 family protein [Haloarchaeobius sp. HRN-SO-5]|uniref:DUF7117 family protein n=1 Tax=Haloarchaeobius sp. HRN-SO-5 TaxID=3446118 RepID=UPI003EBA6209